VTARRLLTAAAPLVLLAAGLVLALRTPRIDGADPFDGLVVLSRGEVVGWALVGAGVALAAAWAAYAVSRPGRPTARRSAGLVPGLAAVVVGAVLVATHQRASYGWFAYTPRHGSLSIFEATWYSHRQVAGWLLTTLGLAALAAYAGRTVARRHA
jgi:hypothetical protein